MTVYRCSYVIIATMTTAYDSILEYSNTKQFGEFRRVLVGNRGSIASGNLASGLTLVYDKNTPDNQTLFEQDDKAKEPIGLWQKLGGRNQPGLIFDKNGYDEVIRQVEARGELSIGNLISKLRFNTDKDDSAWNDLSDAIKKRLISRNLDKLKKETDAQYRTTGDRMHYLTIGLVEVVDYQDKPANYPLFLFSCPELDLNKFSANIDQTGFINFWLDKNIFGNEIGRKRTNNFEITLDSDFANQVNTISEYMNGVNLTSKYKSVKINPQYMAFQIVTGFEAEYVDPAWVKMLDSKDYE